MSNKTRIALLLAITITPASAIAAAKHPAHHPGQTVEQRAAGGAAFARDRQAPATAEPTYMWIQDMSLQRNIGSGD